MSGDRYPITDQHGTYFLTFTVVEWVDVFTRPQYKYIITDALNHCIDNKGLDVFAWVLMTNHMHLIVRANHPYRLSDVVRDFKKHTSKQIAKAIVEIAESRREWLLHKFSYAAQSTGRAEYYKLWRDDSHAILLDGGISIEEKVRYIHNNPVRQLIVSEPEDYLFSSASSYAGSKQEGLVKIILAY